VNVIWLRVGRQTRIVQIDYIAHDNPGAAVRLDEAIERQVRQLRDQPLIGRPGRMPGTRELIISRTPFIVIYRVTETRIEILRVLHGAQQWPRPPETDVPD
jgi:toxin ParE1/3/4